MYRRLPSLLVVLVVVLLGAIAPAAQADFLTTDGGQYANTTVDPTAGDSASDDATADDEGDDAYNDDEDVSGYEDEDSGDDPAVVKATTKKHAKKAKKAKPARRGRGKAKKKAKAKAKPKTHRSASKHR